MPEIIPLAKTRRANTREIVNAELAKMKPGDCIVITDWAEELGISSPGLRYFIPPSRRAVRFVPGRKKPVAVVIPEPCQKSKK